MNKVKDFLNWSKIVFNDRTILKDDIKYLSWEQIRQLDNLHVSYHEENEDQTITLFIKY